MPVPSKSPAAKAAEVRSQPDALVAKRGDVRAVVKTSRRPSGARRLPLWPESPKKGKPVGAGTSSPAGLVDSSGSTTTRTSCCTPTRRSPAAHGQPPRMAPRVVDPLRRTRSAGASAVRSLVRPDSLTAARIAKISIAISSPWVPECHPRVSRALVGTPKKRIRADHSGSVRYARRARKSATEAVCRSTIGSGRWGSNPRPSAWEADALPTELRPRGANPRWLMPRGRLFRGVGWARWGATTGRRGPARPDRAAGHAQPWHQPSSSASSRAGR